MHANWNYPTNISVGFERFFDLENITKQHHISQPFIVVDPFIRQQDYFIKFINDLNEARINHACFDNFQQNPNDQDVERACQKIENGSFDGVIAIGGGSAIDVAKCIALVAKQTCTLWELEDVGDNYLKADPNKILPIIAIPTTAGTGSEVGRASVITDEVSKTKKLIFHPQILPKHVILDPMVTLSIPPALTAATGMDALAHNLEAFLAPGYHPMADGIALEGCRLIKENLLKAYLDGNDIEARQNLLVASSMGATAFQKGLGLIHSLSHPVGAMFHLHHGLLNALFMPYSLLHNKSEIEYKCAQLVKYLDLPTPGFNGFYEFVMSLILSMKLPLSLKALDIDESWADEVALKAYNDPSTPSNPKPLTIESIKGVFLQAVKGNL